MSLPTLTYDINGFNEIGVLQMRFIQALQRRNTEFVGATEQDA